MAEPVLILVALAFAWSLGVHYTGAVMGMPYASRAIAAGPALVLIGILTFLGAALASGPVQKTVGLNIVSARSVTVADAIVIVSAAFILTSVYNYLRVPTSTIQILVFCLVGVALAGGVPIHWITIAHLVVVWLTAPLAAFALGYLFTRLLDILVPSTAARIQAQDEVAASEGVESSTGGNWWRRWFPTVTQPVPPDASRVAVQEARIPAGITLTALRWLPALLVLVGMAASFVLGANDVANATGSLVMTNVVSITMAGVLGGLAMALGAITGGKGILQTVAFDVVRMDLSMASAAQGVQAVVVIIAVTQGFFTSMNQALVGAMAGTGLARGRQTVQSSQIRGIIMGWAIGPISAIALASVGEIIVRAV